MRSRSAGGIRALGIGAVLTAIALTVAGVPVTSAQGPALLVARVTGPLPVDSPFDPAWEAASTATVALSGQFVAPPMVAESAFPAVRVRALSDGDRLAVLIEWDDPTADESTTGENAFADAAAMQIALGSGTSICMGQAAGGLNIWHWKADWAAAMAGDGDLEAVYPNMPTDVVFPADGSDPTLTEDGFATGLAAGNDRSATTHPSSVEDLSAVGFGSLTAQPPEAQSVHGASERRGDTWRVVMSRALDSGDPNDAVLRDDGPAAVVAFAVWDGARGDRDGLKGVSTWLSLILPPHEIGLLDAWPFLLLMATALVVSGAVMAFGVRQPAVGLGWGPGGPRRNGAAPGPGPGPERPPDPS
jgi:hypothetical protein